MLKIFFTFLAVMAIHSSHAQDFGDFQTQRIKIIHAQLAAAHQKLELGTPYPSLVIHEKEWPIDPESFAFEETSLSAESSIHIHKPWATQSSDDAIAFALALSFSKIAQGDFTQKIALKDGDETSLAASAALMQMRVRAMVRSIHNGATELGNAAEKAQLSSSMDVVK